MSDDALKIFRVNDCEWYLAKNLQQAVELAMSDSELPEDEACDNPREVTEEEMNRLKFIDDTYRQDSTSRTFAEELARQIANGAVPGPFATTEY